MSESYLNKHVPCNDNNFVNVWVCVNVCVFAVFFKFSATIYGEIKMYI